MKAKKGFKIRKLGNDVILVPESMSTVNFNKLINLNSSAAYLWSSISERESFTVQDLTDLLLQEYDVDPEVAARDSEAIARKWVEAGIVEE